VPSEPWTWNRPQTPTGQSIIASLVTVQGAALPFFLERGVTAMEDLGFLANEGARNTDVAEAGLLDDGELAQMWMRSKKCQQNVEETNPTTLYQSMSLGPKGAETDRSDGGRRRDGGVGARGHNDTTRPEHRGKVVPWPEEWLLPTLAVDISATLALLRFLRLLQAH